MTTEERYVLIGLGGIGGIVARMLVPFLHHRGQPAEVHLVDGDVFEESNRGRQSFHRLGPKAVVLAEELGKFYGDGVTLVPIPEYVTAQRARFVIGSGDIVFCTPDNHATRRIVERRCARLERTTLFSGGNDGVDRDHQGTYGNVQIYLREDRRDVTNPLSAFHPEIARPKDKLPDQQGCVAQAHAAPQLLFTNLAVASAMLSAFYAWQRGALAYEESYLDILAGRTVPVRRDVKIASRTTSGALQRPARPRHPV